MSESSFGENKRIIDDKRAAADALTEWLLTESVKNYLSETDEITPDSLSEAYLSSFGGELISESFARFCMKTAEMAGDRIIPFPDYTEEDEETVSARISYIKNTTSDKAYSSFSDKLNGASAVYGNSFDEICEEVYYGRTDYALIPIYTSHDGCLSPFRRLILKYDLKIAYMTEIESDDEGITRFALVKKGLMFFPDSVYPVQNMLVSIIPEVGDQFMMILSCIKALGASVFAVNTYSSEYSPDESVYDISFRANSVTRAALWFFLESTHIRYTAVENYIII